MRNFSVVIGAAVVIAAMASSTGALAQGPVRQIPSDNTAYGTTAAEFLLFPAGARGAALGGSFAALTSDVSAVFFNPAGLAGMERPTAMGSSMNYLAGTRYGAIAIGFPMSGGSRALGLSIANFGFGDQPVYTAEDPQGDNGEVYSVNQTVLGLSYATRFSDRFSAGITAKFINDQLGRTTGQAGAVDFGTTFQAQVSGRPIRASFVIQNLGTTLQHSGNVLDVTVLRPPPQGQQPVQQEPALGSLKSKAWGLPVMFRVAVSYDVFSTSGSRFTALSEFLQPNNSEPGFNVAGEYNVGMGRSGFSVAGRAGFTYQPDNNLDPAGASSADYAGFASNVSGEGMDGFSAGGGIKYSRPGFGVGFDYAYRSLGVLGGVNMVTIALSW
ncbi:MAG: PorV/PorQ family protein [Gemmatimonadales bacterium]|nr:PorV/PorQ family protein [Gemmatimonadales bacterium]